MGEWTGPIKTRSRLVATSAVLRIVTPKAIIQSYSRAPKPLFYRQNGRLFILV